MSFVGMKKYSFIFSAVLILTGIISLAVNGLNLGIDFTGGTILHLNMGEEFSISEVRDKVLLPLGLQGAILQSARGIDIAEESHELLIRTRELSAEEQDALFQAFIQEYGLVQEDLLRVENVGAIIGGEMTRQALLALLIASAGMLIYITVRFEFRFAIAAIAALLHDAMAVLTFFSLFQIEVNGPFIAAILTILGYSINDTIVIFDRIRENLKNRRKETYAEIVDKSIRQSLSRTINTAATTLVVVLAIFIFGGVTLRPFMSALLVGMIFGIYSTVFIASPIWLVWKEAQMRKAKVKTA